MVASTTMPAGRGARVSAGMGHRADAHGALRLPPPNGEGHVMTTEAERVGERHVHPALDLAVRRRIEITFGIGRELVDGRWDDAAGGGEHRHPELERARAAKQVS